jgi:AraC family transcriptional regulator, transcriptional activator FtrA
MVHTLSDMTRVALAVSDGMLLFEMSVAFEVFGTDLAEIVNP